MLDPCVDITDVSRWNPGTLLPMENRHLDALRRIAQADAMWAADGNEPRTFLLIYTGAMQKIIDHPRWDESWSTPGTSTIDDLGELGLLRIASADPSRKGRTFELTLTGREKARELAAQPVAPAEDVPQASMSHPETSDSPDEAAVDAPSAFVSWAHADESWQETVATFAFKLRELGIDADIDLFHLHDPDIDWTTYGPRAIDEREFVVIPVSADYKKRWEGRSESGTGAGLRARQMCSRRCSTEIRRRSDARSRL